MIPKMNTNLSISKLPVPEDVSETNIDCCVADKVRVVLVENKV